MGKKVRLLWELNQPSTAVPAALPWKDILPVHCTVYMPGQRAGLGGGNWQVQCWETKYGGNRFNSKEWRLCLPIVGRIHVWIGVSFCNFVIGWVHATAGGGVYDVLTAVDTIFNAWCFRVKQHDTVTLKCREKKKSLVPSSAAYNGFRSWRNLRMN